MEQDLEIKEADLPLKWKLKDEAEKAELIKRLLNHFFQNCTESIQKGWHNNISLDTDDVKEIRNKVDSYASGFESVLRQRSKYFFHIDFNDPKNICKHLEYVWMQDTNTSEISPIIKIVILETFNARTLNSLEADRTCCLFRDQNDIHSALDKYFVELSDLASVCRENVRNYANPLGRHHAKVVELDIKHAWCRVKQCSEDGTRPFIQAAIHTIERKLLGMDGASGKMASIQDIIRTMTAELGNFQQLFTRPGISIAWSRCGLKTTWDANQLKRRENMLQSIFEQSHRLIPLSGVHLIPPVYAQCNGKLTKFSYKPGMSAARPQFLSTNRIDQDILKASKHLRPAYNFEARDNKDLASVLADKNVVYVLLVTLPQLEVGINGPGVQVQAYVGSAKEGLTDAWFFQPGSHLQNAMDLLQYYKVHCKCSRDSHILPGGDHRHFPPRNPPPLVDCILLYAKLKGYKTELYIVDRARPGGKNQSEVEASLEETRLKWTHRLTANDRKWGLNPMDGEQSAYIVDFKNEKDPRRIIRYVEALWRQQMRLGPKGRISATIKTVIVDLFGSKKPPYVIDGIKCLSHAMSAHLHSIESLQSIYLAESRKFTTKRLGLNELLTLTRNASTTWCKLNKGKDIPSILDAAIKDTIDLFSEEATRGGGGVPEFAHSLLLRIHRQLVLFYSMFERKKLGIEWSQAPASTWAEDPRQRRAKVLDSLYWQQGGLGRMVTAVKRVLDLMPPVYAKYGDRLAKCSYDRDGDRGNNAEAAPYASRFTITTVTSSESKQLKNIEFLQQLYNTKKIKQGSAGSEEEGRAYYNVSRLDDISMLKDPYLIYVLTISLPKSEVTKKANRVQCYVGKAGGGGIRERWHRQAGSHLRNARDVLRYFVQKPACPHLQNPPSLVDCMLIYAHLLGYDVALYLVDKVTIVPADQGGVNTKTGKLDRSLKAKLNVELERKRMEWTEAIRSYNMFYGLNMKK